MTIKAVLVRFVPNEDGGTAPHYVIEQLEAVDEKTLSFMAEDAAEGFPYLCLSPSPELVQKAEAENLCLYAAAGWGSQDKNVTFQPVLVFFTAPRNASFYQTQQAASDAIQAPSAWFNVVPVQL